jgi:hypothetical protein
VSILHDYPEKAYHARSEISGSMLNDFAVSPYHYYAKYVAKTPWIKNEFGLALSQGAGVHILAQEPHNWRKRFYVAPDMRRQGKEWETHVKIANGREILKHSEAMECVKMAWALNNNARVRDGVLRHDGYSECTVLWTDPDTGLECRGRLDRLSIVAQFVSDFKSAADASPRKFLRAVLDNRYHVKAAFYLDGLVAQGVTELAGAADWPYLWPVVEKETYAVELYAAPPDMIKRGREIYKTELRRLKGCFDSGHWPSYTENIALLEMPEWANRDYNPTTEVEL